MIICFRADRTTRDRLDYLVSSGDYRDYGEAISVAISNLLSLHEEYSGEPIIIGIGGHEGKTSSVLGKGQNMQISMVPEYRHKSDEPTRVFISQFPSLFRDHDFTECDLLESNPLAVEWKSVEQIPIEHWMFGQYNKLLPLKISIRALCNLVCSTNSPIELDEAGNIIADQVRAVAEILTKLDDAYDNSRDEMLSTAFPSPDAEMKSILRYKNQFVGAISKDGKLSGLLRDFNFINISQENADFVLPTSAGWEFASIRNPILEGDYEGHRFSEEEFHFLINHIRDSVPVEKFAYELLLQLISRGINTPSLLDNELVKNYRAGEVSKVSESFLSTQRSGAISRMCDLGVVRRVWHGTAVSYELTEKSKEFLMDDS
jgi:hypothetical protein